MKKLQLLPYILIFVAFSLGIGACSDSESYADLLNDENKDVNAFLANHRVIDHVPDDSIFEVGKNAPYYRMDEDGNVYMQVLDTGNGVKAEDDQMIYFRYTRYNLKNYSKTDSLPAGNGNADNMEFSPTWFRLNNYMISASSQYGMGIQIPMLYLSYNCEVNIIIKSQYGFTSEISYVNPFLFNVRYFKPGV